MFYERPLRDFSRGVPSGGVTTLGEIWDSTWDSMRLVDNFNGSAVALERAYDARNDAIPSAVGIPLKNPMRDFMADPGEKDDRLKIRTGASVLLSGIGYNSIDPHALYQTQLEKLAEQHPDFADIIAADRPVIQEARRLAAASERRFDDVWARSNGGLSAWATRLTAGFGGTFTDPANVATAVLLGPFGEAGAGVKGLVWMGIKAGAANAAGEAFTQPFVQDWRKQAGLPHGLDIAATNVAAAALFGFGLDAGVRSAVRGVRRAAGRPYLGPAPDAESGLRTGETGSGLRAPHPRSAFAAGGRGQGSS